MGELYEPFPRLPKNIRQIGERDQILRLYLEDYVNTYLKRLQPAKGADLRVGLLLGSRETHEDMPYVFVDGALEMDSVTEEGEKVVFTEDAWKKAYQDVERMFPKRTVQGWFLCGGPGCALSPLNYWRQHSQYFTGKNQLMFLNCGLEGEEAIYITSSDGFYKLRGYSVYYERNQMMQDYMISRRDLPKVESGVNDKVIYDFKQKMDERRYEAVHHKSTVGALSGICSVLAVTVLAGGVAMFNNYQKMHEMESVIASAMQEGSVKGILASAEKSITQDPSGKGWSTADRPDYVIEEAAGNVFPTTAPEDGKDQASQITPESMPPAKDAAGDAQKAEPTDLDATASESAKDSKDQTSSAETEAVKSSQASSEGADGSKPSEGESAPIKAENAGDGGSQKNSDSQPAGETKPSDNSSAQAQAQESQPASQGVSAVNYSVYTVGDGETLYGICFKLYQNLDHLEEICRVNGLADQNSIFSGQKLLVP